MHSTRRLSSQSDPSWTDSIASAVQKESAVVPDADLMQEKLGEMRDRAIIRAFVAKQRAKHMLDKAGLPSRMQVADPNPWRSQCIEKGLSMLHFQQRCFAFQSQT